MTTTILGSNKFFYKGKAVEQTIQNYNEETSIEVPPQIIEEYKDVALWTKIFYINGLPFLVAIAKHLGFGQCIYLRRQTSERLIEGL